MTPGGRLTGLAFRSRRRIATALAVVLAVVLGYHVVFGQNGLTIYQQKKLEDRTLSLKIHDLQEQNSQLKAHVERLKNSPDAIEHEAREKLHYTRPGEVIYTLNEKPASERTAEASEGKTSEDKSAADAAVTAKAVDGRVAAAPLQ